MHKEQNSKRHLAAAVASLMAVSMMAASVMGGCGEDKSESKADTSATQVVTNADKTSPVAENSNATETAKANNKPEKAAKNSNSKTNGNSSASSQSDKNTGSNNSDSGNSKNNTGSNNNTSSGSSSANNNSANKSNGTSNNSSGNSSNKNNNTSSNNSSNNSAKNDTSSSANHNSNQALKIGGKTFYVGDSIVCTYTLTTPEVIENYQGILTYDSSKLELKDFKMSGPAASGQMVNPNVKGEVNLCGTEVMHGYDYTNGGEFMSVTYKVKASGTTSPKFKWTAACKRSDSSNLIDDNGKPTNGLVLKAAYKTK